MQRAVFAALIPASVAVDAMWPSAVAVQAAPPAAPTFNKDVLPVLQKQVRNAIGRTPTRRCRS